MAKSNAPKMGLRDDIMYTTVEYEVGCYHRIEFFKTELKEFLPRFQRIYGQLPESMTRSAEDLGLIINSMQDLIHSSPMLFMFGPTHSKIPKGEFVRKGKPKEVQINAFEELHHLHEHAKKHKMALAMCTLRMMDSKQGKDALKKVASVFGVNNMMFYVDIVCEHNKDMLANILTNLAKFLKMEVNNLNVVYESRKEIIAGVINNHMEHKFANTFVSLNKFIVKITKKINRTHVSTFGDKFTEGRFYWQVKRQFENVKTLTDLLVTSNGESTEEKLATAIVAFTKTLLITEIADTYEMQDVQVFDYCQYENFSDIWKTSLQTHLLQVPLLRQFDQFVRTPNDESVRRDVERNYKQNDASTIGRLVTSVLMGNFLQVGETFRNMRVTLDDLTTLRKELQTLIEETVDGDKYVECVPNLEHWRTLLKGIKEVNGMGLVLGKFFVSVEPSASTEREIEVCKQVERLLKGIPGEVVVEVATTVTFAGKEGTGTNSEIVIGDAFVSESGARGTIGLFMHECDAEDKDLHFVTCSHVVLGSNRVKTNDQNPVLLGTTRHTLFFDNGLVDVAAIRIEEAIKDRCNIFFKDDGELCKCNILDMKAIQNLKEGQHVYKRGSTTGETKGCIISQDFRGVGLQDHNFLVGLPVGLDEASRSKGFAQEGDSGSVLYTKTPDGEVQFIALLTGKFTLKEREGKPNSTFICLTKERGSLILTTCLQEGLNKIENKFKLKLTLPVEECQY